MNKTHLFIVSLIINCQFIIAQDIAVLKYNGGGDWYANPTALTNLISFCNENINTKINNKYQTVTTNSPELALYPFIHIHFRKDHKDTE